ncbi:MAG: hypothetical protein ACTSRH_00945 [Promethearchaeota archaeon]
MTKILEHSLIGLEEYIISFERYCSACEVQKNCKYGKNNPFTVNINCADLKKAKERVRFEQLQKIQKNADISLSYEQLLKKVKINLQNIFSEIWKEKIKRNKDDLLCLNSQKMDPILVSQQGQLWWQDFNVTMRDINAKCENLS